jgi:predicted acylesterase/phospholipase RssA
MRTSETPVVRRAFICSGGGLRGCFQVGAIDYLVTTAGIVPDLVCGISTGSLQALGLTVGDKEQRTARLLQVWNGLSEPSDVYTTPRLRLFKEIPAILADIRQAKATHGELNGSWRQGWHELSGLAGKIEQTFDRERIQGSDIRLMVGAVDLLGGGLIYFDSRTTEKTKRKDAEYELRPLDHWKLVLASCSIPVFFPPVEHDGCELVDGGVRDIAPLGVAIDTLIEMAERAGDVDPQLELYIMLCTPRGAPPVSRRGNIASIALRTMDLMCDEILRNDIDVAETKNDLLDRHPDLTDRYRHLDMIIIEPDHPLIDVLEVDPGKIQAGIAQGRERAREVLQEQQARGR